MNWDDTTDTPAAERLVGSVADREDQAVEAALRPKDLDEFIGQEKVREQLDLVLRAARARGALPTCRVVRAPAVPSLFPAVPQMPVLGRRLPVCPVGCATKARIRLRIESGPP